MLTDMLTKQGDAQVQALEPFLLIPESKLKGHIREGIRNKWTKLWRKEHTCHQTHELIPVVPNGSQKELLKQYAKKDI